MRQTIDPDNGGFPSGGVTLSEHQYSEAQKLYILGAKLDNFRTIGPWHSVEAKYLDNLCYRLASPVPRPCSRKHDEGAWAAEDQVYMDYPRPISSVKSAPPGSVRRSRGSPSAKSKNSGYSLPIVREGNRQKNEKRSNSKISTEDVDRIVCRVTRPTIASRGGVDIAEKYENKDYVYGSRSVSEVDLDSIVSRVTRPTVASTGGAGKQRKYTDFVYGDKKVNEEEFNGIINRLTKPTVASRGGVDIADKMPVEYKPLPITKTNPVVPGLRAKQAALLKKRVNTEELEQIVGRLNTLTPAYKAKYSPSPHVWVDDAKVGPAFQRQQVMAA